MADHGINHIARPVDVTDMPLVQHGMVNPAIVDPYPPRCTVEGIAVTAFRNPQSLFERVVLETRAAASRRRPMLVHYLNIHVANTALRQKSLKRILQNSPLVYCDGTGVRVGARLLGAHIPLRLTAADWFLDMLRWYAQARLTVFLFGSAPGVPEATMRVVNREVPEHTVVGFHHGHIFMDPTREQEVLCAINSAKPDIVIVGLGTPLQELWIDHHAPGLKVCTFQAIGAAMDFVSGHAKRCSPVLRDAGCEWLFRLYREPRRLLGRYLIGNPWFLSRMVYYALLQRRKSGTGKAA